VIGIDSGSRVLRRVPEPRWPEKLPEVGIPAVEAKSRAGRLLSIVFAGVAAAGSVGAGEEYAGLTEVCVRGGGCVG
jgi:hypothetical protein